MRRFEVNNTSNGDGVRLFLGWEGFVISGLLTLTRLAQP